MLRRQQAITLVEVLIVILIVTTLAGIAFAMSGPMREKSRQTVCASQLKQIYQALMLYRSDYPDGPSLPGHDSIPVFRRGVVALDAYVKDQQIFWCPDVPSSKRSKNSSSYLWKFLAYVPELLDDKAFNEMVMGELQRLGEAFPIVVCHTHDRMYYFPRERDIHASFTKAFAIELWTDGSVHSGRRDDPRIGWEPWMGSGG